MRLKQRQPSHSFTIEKSNQNPFYHLKSQETFAWLVLCAGHPSIFRVTDVGQIIFSFLTVAELLTVTRVSKSLMHYRSAKFYDTTIAAALCTPRFYHGLRKSTNRFKISANEHTTLSFQLRGEQYDVWGNRDVAFNAIQKIIITLDTGYSATVRDANTHQSLCSLIGHAERIKCATIRPDGCYIATGSDDRAVKIWSSQTGRCLYTIMHPASVDCIEFSSDGQRFASVAKNTISVWDVNTMQCLAKMIGRPRTTLSLSFGENGQTVIAAATDGSLETWDIAIQKQLAAVVIAARTRCPFIAVEASADGKHIAALTNDNFLRVFNSEGKQIASNKLSDTARTLGVCNDFLLIGFEDGRTRQYAFAHFMVEMPQETIRLSH